ncbi:metalloprotease [Colletotrichum musicola]|uniref:Metalloprotease n=1 Tax=Colletotrichum musicola TaxID=2175873 RepID=A0A8H6K4T6_9PEZI|nr:metalloprotease [Colletotrichum musicola]
MRISRLLLVLLSLTSEVWAQSSNPSNPEAPATTPVRQAETSAPAAPATSAARPPPSVEVPSIAPTPVASSAARPNLQKTSAAVSPSAPNGPANSARPSSAAAAGPSSASDNVARPATTATSAASRVNGATTQQRSEQIPPASSRGGGDRTVDSPSAAPTTRATTVNANSNNPQATRAPTGSVQGGGTDTAAAPVASTATGTAARPGLAQPSVGAGGGNDTLSGGSGSSVDGAAAATASPSSPGLKTVASFAAQPSDSFRSVNDSVVEKMPESSVATPPDVATVDQFRAELNANIPEKSLTEKNARALAIMETAYFEYFVEKDPAPVDVGRLTIPNNIQDCGKLYSERLVRKRTLFDEVLDWVPLMSRDLRGFDSCKAVTSLEVGVYFQYMRASSSAERPNELESRVKAQVALLNEALGAVKINFRYMALNWWEPKANEDWTSVTRKDSKLQDWQQRSRAPGKLTLTVWIVNGLLGSENSDLNSYATFPDENLDPHDGIVIAQEHVQGGDATTLVHDVGHWLGLGHTFGALGEQCVIQDGLTNATQTSGMRDVVYECSQVPCVGGPAVDINNYMSYSSCRGRTPQNGFTTDQKARMFANAIQFRRGYEAGECSPDGKAAVQKRSSMQDLLDGKCPNYDQQASILLNKPHSLGLRLSSSSSQLWALAGVWMALLLS